MNVLNFVESSGVHKIILYLFGMFLFHINHVAKVLVERIMVMFRYCKLVWACQRGCSHVRILGQQW